MCRVHRELDQVQYIILRSGHQCEVDNEDRIEEQWEMDDEESIEEQ